MSFLKFFHKNLGQHTIEYIVLLTLIMAGIIITGPYVIRSWNAHLKGWEDATVDSLQEEFIEAPPIAVSCKQNDWIRLGCQATRTACSTITKSCSELESLWLLDFDPNSCQCGLTPIPNFLECRVDPCCCTKPRPLGLCGADAASGPIGIPEPDCNKQMLPRNTDNTCPYGTMLGVVQCGGDPGEIRYGCMNEMPDGTDPIPGNGIYDDCVFQCIPKPDPPDPGNPAYFGLCPDDDIDLTADVHYSFIEYGNPTGIENCTATKCEWICAPGYEVIGSGETAGCGKVCDEGVYVNGCPAETYDPQGCAAGFHIPCCIP